MRVVGLCLVVLLCAACGIPLDEEARAIEVELGDAGQIEQASGPELAAVSMYLVEDDRLVPVTRDLPEPASVADVLGSLVSGETEPEDRAGLRSSIPVGTELLGVRVEGATLHIDLSSRFAAVGGEQELLAVAQVVLTASRLAGVESVAFEIEGIATAVPTADGALSTQPVTAADYAELTGG